MATSFANAVAGMQAAVRSHRGQTVAYSRGSDSVDVTAVAGSTRVESVDESGFAVQSRRRDFLIARSVLVLGGSTITPRKGDRIRMTVGSDVRVYEVLPLDGAECYRDGDSAGLQLRIHAAEIDVEEA